MEVMVSGCAMNRRQASQAASIWRGRVPRLAHWRTRPFFWPMRASSWNQISIGLRAAMGPRWALSVSGTFFERLDRALILRRVTRAGADVREAELVQELADRALMVGDPEAIEDHPLQVDPTPAHHAMHGSVRTGLDEPRDLSSLLLGKARLGTFGPAVPKAIGTVRVEPMHPVPQGLPVHAADPRRLRPVHAVHNRSQRKQPAALVRVLG